MSKEDNAIKGGDLVQLRSGGPVMTAEDVADDDNEIRCVWFSDGKEGSLREYFKVTILKVVNQEE